MILLFYSKVFKQNFFSINSYMLLERLLISGVCVCVCMCVELEWVVVVVRLFNELAIDINNLIHAYMHGGGRGLCMCILYKRERGMRKFKYIVRKHLYISVIFLDGALYFIYTYIRLDTRKLYVYNDFSGSSVIRVHIQKYFLF